MLRVMMLAVVVALVVSAAHAQGLTGALAARLADDPRAILEQAEEAILGHGDARGIDRAGLLRMIAIDRAAARARTLGQILAADLDGDGGVAAVEAAATAATRSAGARTRFLRLVANADADGNGTVSAGELRSVAEAQALRAVSSAREGRLLDLMALDADGDGWLTLAEVRAGVAAAQAAQAAPGDGA